MLPVCHSWCPFTLDVCVCVNVDVESNFNIMLKMMETQIQRMGHSLCYTSTLMKTQTFFVKGPFNGSSTPKQVKTKAKLFA